MQSKVLSPVEQDIIEGKPSSIEQALLTETKPEERCLRRERATRPSLLTQHQTQQALEADTSVSYSTDAHLAQVFLSSPSSQGVIEALYQGYSLNQAAAIAFVSIETARKVLAVLQKQ